jgi:hypothetical protein
MEPDNSQPRPSLQECIDFWKRGPEIFESKEWDHPDHQAVVSSLSAVFSNGGAKFGMFSFRPEPLLTWFLSRNRYNEIFLFENLLASQAFRAAFPDVPPYARPKDSLGWTWSSPYVFGGDIAWTLMCGGPYNKFPGTGRDAMALGAALSNALWGDRFEEIHVLRCNVQWSEWFCDVAWDHTWVGLDMSQCLIWTLSHMDTD